MPDWFAQNAPTAPKGDWFDLYSPDRKPASAEDFAPPARDVSVGSMLGHAVKSLNPLPAIQALAADARPEDAALGPMAAVAPLLRAAGSGAVSEARKAAAAPTGWEAAGHAAAAALPLVGPAAAQAGEDIGSGDPERIERGGGQAIGLVGSMVAPRVVAKVTPKVAPALATIGEQLTSKGKALTDAAGKVSPIVKDIAVEVAGHAIGAPLGIPTIARRVLGHVLSSAEKAAPEVSNAGGRIVKGSKLTDEAALAQMLEKLRDQTAPPKSAAETPSRRSTDVPPDRTGHFTLPKPKAMLNDAQIEDFLTRHGGTGPVEAPMPPASATAPPPAPAQPPARVTTPPQASLPPGYTPRTTVPKPKAAKPRVTPTETPKATPKRAYFLKAVEEISDETGETAPRVTAKGEIRQEDLPASWQSHTGQDLFPLTGEEGKAVVSELRQELKDRGMSTGEAMALVSKNKAIPVQIRTQLLRALNGAVQ